MSYISQYLQIAAGMAMMAEAFNDYIPHTSKGGGYRLNPHKLTAKERKAKKAKRRLTKKHHH